MKISFKKFDQIYQKVVEDIYSYWTPEMQQEISTHCYGWRLSNFNFNNYLRASSIRYYKAYNGIALLGKDLKICDIGSFFGAFPVMLRALGYDVTITEALNYYSKAFDPLFQYISEQGISIIAYDPFENGVKLTEHYDFITVMAVLEHYPHSLKIFMDNIKSLLRDKGILYIEVPNIAYWPNRIKLLFGKSPLSDIKDIYHSKIPYIGHHHEFTMLELKELLTMSGLIVISEDYFNYSWKLSSLKNIIRNPLQGLANFIKKDTREILALACKINNSKS